MTRSAEVLPTSRVTAPRPVTTMYRVWAVAFSVGVLIDEVQRGADPRSWHTLVALAAIGVLVRPSSVERMVALLAAAAVMMLWYLPDVWNHTFVIGVVGGVVALWWLAAAARGHHDVRTEAGFLRAVAPVLRGAFLVTWVFAAVAKLNSGFFDVVSSCAMWIYESIPLLPALPATGRQAMIVASLAAELAIPVLLVVRRTRMAAIALGWAFHLVTAIAGHAAFAGFAWSFYLLFLPESVTRRLVDVVDDLRTSARRHIRLPRSPGVLWVGLGTTWLALMATLQLLPVGAQWPVRRSLAALAFVVWAMVWAVILVRTWRGRRPAVDAPSAGFWRLRPLMAAGLAVLVLSGVSPYLGLKTQYSFTMYSNLRTEEGRWNHLVLPAVVQVADWQEDLVQVVGTDDTTLAREVGLEASGATVWLPRLELRRQLQLHPSASVDYVDGPGGTVRTTNAADPTISAGDSFVMRKLAAFRPVPDAPGCQH